MPRILIVDSDRTTAFALASAVRAAGFEALGAADISAALASAARSAPDAIALSARAADSLGAIARFKASVHTASPPIVVYGMSQGYAPEPWLSAGARQVLEVLAEPAQVAAAIQRALEAPPAPRLEAPGLGDPLRLAALRASGLLDDKPVEAFERVTTLVAGVLEAPTAMLSLVDKDRTFFKSHIGLGGPLREHRAMPASHSFCQWVVAGRERVLINDAREHTMMRHSPSLTAHNAVAYAGAPVYGGNGQVLGSLCVMDGRPRTWNDEDMTNLQDLARLVESCAAQTELSMTPPSGPEGYDRFVGAAGEAIEAATAVLRRRGSGMAQAHRDVLLDLINQRSRHLVQLNRMIQVAGALG